MRNDETISLVAKLMNTQLQNNNESGSLEKLYEVVNKKVLTAIENSGYIQKSAIRDEITDNLDSFRIIADNPELAGKTVIGVAPCKQVNPRLIEKILPTSAARLLNSTVPTLITASQQSSCYAVNKLGNRILLTKEEVKHCNFLYHDAGINIKSLVSYFVLNTPAQTDSAAYVYIPHYSFNGSNRILFDTVDYMVLLCSEAQPPEERLKALRHYYHGKVIILPLDEASKTAVSARTGLFADCIAADEDSVKDMIASLIEPRNNYCPEPELILPLLRIQKYLYGKIQQGEEQMVAFNSDLLKLESASEKQQTNTYKKQLADEIKKNKKVYDEIRKCIEQLSDVAENYEKYVEMYLVGREDITQCHKDYFSLYFQIFLQYSSMKESVAVSRYQSILTNRFKANMVLCNEYAGYLHTSVKIPASLVEKAKKDGTCIGKYILCGCCVRNNEYHQEVVKSLSSREKDECNADELCYLGLWAEQKEEYDKANGYYRDAVHKGSMQAGERLIKLSSGDSETKRSVWEELSEHMVPEANFRLARLYRNKEPRKEEFYLRLAAACGHFQATKDIADKMFDAICEKEECESVLDGRKKGVDAAAKKDIKALLKTYLAVFDLEKSCRHTVSADERKTVLLNIGVLYYLISDYTNAFTYLNQAQTGQAFFLLGLIYENGYGVSRSLEKASGCYRKAKYAQYPAAAAREAKVKGKIAALEAQKEAKQQELNEKLEERSTSYGDSSWCFITTAVCESLGKPANCPELEKLRDYRDMVLDKDPDGPAMIKEYYRIAPGIVERINADADHKQVYSMLYEKYIVPTVEEFDRGNYSAAKARYAKMVMELYEKFPPQ